ncbi:hypothetical protein BDZ97DRAFT_1921234 [Flammula alnicola]|nr:hypothetical protein BDZ97DRAFT_1921234 [Flammula alnicola]
MAEAVGVLLTTPLQQSKTQTKLRGRNGAGSMCTYTDLLLLIFRVLLDCPRKTASTCTTSTLHGVTETNSFALQGVSHSLLLLPHIVIAYLIRNQGMSYDAARALVRRKRACIRPNTGFVGTLQEGDVSHSKLASARRLHECPRLLVLRCG